MIRFAFRNVSLWVGLEVGKPGGQLSSSSEEKGWRPDQRPWLWMWRKRSRLDFKYVGSKEDSTSCRRERSPRCLPSFVLSNLVRSPERGGWKRENLLSHVDSIPSEFWLRNIQSICQKGEKIRHMESNEEVVRESADHGAEVRVWSGSGAASDSDSLPRSHVWRGWHGS